MKMSSSVSAIFPAYIKARQEINVIYKDKKVSFKQVSYGYADLPQIVEAINAVTFKYGLSFLQPLGKITGERYLKTSVSDVISIENILIHDSGEWMSKTAQVLIEDGMPSKIKNNGASVTYGRRICALAFWFLSVEDEVEKNCNSYQSRQSDKVLDIPEEFSLDLLKFYISASSVPDRTEKAIIESFKGKITRLDQLSMPSIAHWCKQLSKKLSEK